MESPGRCGLANPAAGCSCCGMFRMLFLPLGLLLMLAVGLVWPAPGQALTDVRVLGLSIGHIVVVVIFFLSGYTLRLAQLWHNVNRPLPIVLAVLLNLILAPVMALLLGMLFRVPEGVLIGLVVATSVPTTLSSAMIIANQSGGNGTLALVLTVMLTVVGVVTTPLMVGLCLSFGTELELSYWDLLMKLVFLVMIPLAIGYAAKKLIRREGGSLFSYIASSGVILFVWIVVSQSSDDLMQLGLGELLVIITLCLGVHLILLGLGLAAGRLIRADGPSTLSLGLCTGQKTLPVAMTVLLAIENSGVAPALVAEAAVICVMFHLLQIIGDSILAPWLAKLLGIRRGAALEQPA